MATLATLAAGPAFGQATALPGSNVMISPVGGGFLTPRALVSQDLYQGGSCATGNLFFNNAGAVACLTGGLNNQVLRSITGGAPAFGGLTAQDLYQGGACANGAAFYNNAGAIACTPSGFGTVTSVAQTFTGGLITVAGSPITTSGTLALTVAGTSGSVPYFSSGTAWASSGVLGAGQLVQGGGAGAAPSTFALGGDCTLASPNITCSKTGGVAFTPLATLATGASGTVLIGGASPSYSANPSVSTVTATGLASSGSLGVNAANMVGDGVTNNNSAFSTIWSGLAGGGYVRLPCGVFKVTTSFAVTLAASKHLTLQGSGVDCTELYFSGTTAGLSVTYGSQTSGVRFRDLTITTDDSTGVNTAVTLAASSVTQQGGVNEFINVTIRGHDGYMVANYFGVGILETDVSNINFQRFNYYGTALPYHGIGINLQSVSATQFSAVLNVADSSFWGMNIGVQVGDYTQGLQVSTSNFTSGNLGINVPAGLHAANLDQISVVNSQFGSLVTAGIQELTNVINTTITNNSFIIPSAGWGIEYGAGAGANQYVISSNIFGGANTTNTAGIVFLASSAGGLGGLISDNQFETLQYSINYVAGAGAIVTNNQFFNIANFLGGSATVIGYGNVPEMAYAIASLPTCGASMYGVRLIVSNGTAYATGVYGGAVGTTGAVWRQIMCTPSLGWVYN